MTMKEMDQRLAALEAQVKQLQAGSAATPGSTVARSWLEDAGAFRDDPGFAEIVRLGREWRESTRPGHKPKTTKPKPVSKRVRT